jgi:hypothetical protein
MPFTAEARRPQRKRRGEPVLFFFFSLRFLCGLRASAVNNYRTKDAWSYT